MTRQYDNHHTLPEAKHAVQSNEKQQPTLELKVKRSRWQKQDKAPTGLRAFSSIFFTAATQHDELIRTQRRDSTVSAETPTELVPFSCRLSKNFTVSGLAVIIGVTCIGKR